MNAMRHRIATLAAALAFATGTAAAQHHVHDTTTTKPDPAPTETVDHSSHAGMQHGAMDRARNDTDAAQAPRTPIPPITDADRAAARAPAHGHDHGERVVGTLLFDRLEAWNDHGGGQAWEAQGWLGTDAHKLWLRSEGEREDGRTASADIELLYGRPLARWWDVVAGVRHETRPGPTRTAAALGVIGVAQYKFEVEATGYLDASGRLSAQFAAEYDVLLTNRLILQPRIDAGWHARRDRDRGIGAGLSTIETGVRLRYEITRRFAPYVGIVHERSFGDTADLRRDEGESAEDTRAVAGLRFWF